MTSFCDSSIIKYVRKQWDDGGETKPKILTGIDVKEKISEIMNVV